MLGRSVEGVVAYPAADHITEPPEAEQNTVQKATKAKRSKKRQSKSSPLCVLCVGTVSPRKGLSTVIEALAFAPKGTAVVHIVGSLEMRTYVGHLKYQVDRIGLAGRVMFWGSLSGGELHERYQEADLLAVPSYEGFGIVYLEAMRYGLPAIGSTAGAAHEIITPGKNGFLVDPYDSGQLALHLVDLHQDRGKLRRMSHAALKRYAKHPSWDESMKKAYEWMGKMSG